MGRQRRTDQPAIPSPGGYLHESQRAWVSLLFIAPALVVFEIGAMFRPPNLVAREALTNVFAVFGLSGRLMVYVPGVVLVVLLLAIHAARREPWTFRWETLGFMLVESLMWAAPMLLLDRIVSGRLLSAAMRMVDEALLSIGAGLYEELVFRLILISLGILLLHDVLGMRPVLAAAVSVAASSLLFSWVHFAPVGRESFAMAPFLFRLVAGGFLAGVYVLRGFGVAAGAHIIYDLIVSALNHH